MEIPNAGKNVKVLDLSYIACMNVKWYGHLGKQHGSFLKPKHTLTIKSISPTPGHPFQGNTN